VLAEGTVKGVGSMAELSHMDDPAIRQFFDGPRARAAQEQEQVTVQTRGEIARPASKPK
jgi:phospholipid/cholesterol/gamma-HCH transport system ATP-binding protein